MKIVPQILLLIGMGFMAWLIFRIPTKYMEEYVEWIHKRHGLMIIYSVGVLLMVAGIGIFTMNTMPGRYPQIEIVSCSVVVLLSLIIAWDNFNFWRSQYRNQDL